MDLKFSRVFIRFKDIDFLCFFLCKLEISFSVRVYSMHSSEILSIERALCLKQIQERMILSRQII